METNRQEPLERAAGILLPVFSLPGRYGIGTLGSEAYRFVEFLEASGQKLWQMLPCGPTGFGNSPYQPFSAFAGNPYFISPEVLCRWGYLTAEEAQTAEREPGLPIDYGNLYENRLTLLRKAAARFDFDNNGEYADFCLREQDWLADFALFMALKGRYPGTDWYRWPEEIRLRKPEAVSACEQSLAEEIRFWKFVQFCFFSQWHDLRCFAEAHNVRLIGDLPIYVASDSADVWAHQELFLLDAEGRPEAVAGVPPDYFSATGQRWGNPLYRWDRMAEDHYGWWRRRMAANAGLYDYLRIDHFIGLVRYWAVPASCDTALEGSFLPGPGAALLDAILPELGDCRLLAEDLGVLHPDVQKLLLDSGYPGMKVLLFAFDGDHRNLYLPHMHCQNAVCYVGTHDNETLAGFCANKNNADAVRQAKEYFELDRLEEVPAALRRAALFSVCNTAIISMADWLNLSDRARINTPGTAEGNWLWRLEDWQLDHELVVRIRRLTEQAGRL